MSHTPQWLEQQGTSFHPFSLSLLLLLPTLFLIFRFNRARIGKLNLPPSPLKLPIIGNLHQLGSLPHRSLRNLSQKHGPLMLLHLGHAPTLVVSSADAAREIMKTHDLVFLSRPVSSVPKRLIYDSKDIAFAPYGEYWRQMRRICTLRLLSAKKVKSFRAVREEETALMIDKIGRSSSSSSSPKSSGVVDLSETLMSLTNDIICRVALGRKYSGEEVGKRFRKMMAEFVCLLGVFNVGDFIPSLAWVNYFNGLNQRVEKNFKELDCFLEGVVKDHIHCKKREVGGGEVDEDFVDVLLGIEKDSSVGVRLARDDIKAIILDMFAGGTDTSYTVLEWAMAELVRHPEILKEVQGEVREIARAKPYVTEDDLEKMHYLKLVIKETLRLHPPVPLLVPRESTENIKIKGFDIPAKTRVFVNAWAIGRDPVSWEEPEKFQPKRFLGSSINYIGHDFELIPFGAGRRACPGTLFAIANTELALANLLYRFDWTLPDGASGVDLDMAERSGMTVHKKSPLLLVATPYTAHVTN